MTGKNGGQPLKELLVTGAEADALSAAADGLPALRLSARSLSDLELLAIGGYSPLDGFVSYDERQAAAARLVGLRTMSPGGVEE